MRNNGNVLFLILIAVALFAMLTFAVTDAENESGNIDDEMGSVYATQVIQYANDMKTAVSRLRMTNGCRNDQISFYVADVDGLENNIHNTPAPDKCNVFHVNGGGMDYHLPDVWFDGSPNDTLYEATACATLEPCISGSARLRGVGTDGTDISNRDLIMTIREVNKNICIALNRKLGIDASGDTDATHPLIPKMTTDNDAYRRFKGDYSEHSLRDMFTTDGSGSDPLFGQKSGCYEGSRSTYTRAGNYYFYHVLIAR